MKQIFHFLLLLIIPFCGLGQPRAASKTYVFKVKAPANRCTVTMNDSVFWLEKDNKVTVKLKDSNNKIRVNFFNGNIISQESDEYTVRFTDPGKTVLSVYEKVGGQYKLVYTKSYKVQEPTLYFCGVKIGTKAGGLKLNDGLKAYSALSDRDIKILGYEMVYYNGISTKTFSADTNTLSQGMIDVIFDKEIKDPFRFQRNKRVYFANISAVMPDGNKKMLTPFEIFLERDSANTDELAFIFSIKKVYKTKQ